jgi:hypothetical protein
MPMEMHREARGQTKPSADTTTRAMPAFHLLSPVTDHSAETEEIEGGYWPSGIDYESLKAPAATRSESIDDRLDVLELLDDD